MQFTPSKINTFNFLNLPSVWWCGIRVKKITETECTAKVKHRWINQNPFRSMFWAVQGMAAELTTGVLVMREIAHSGKKISMLVANNKAQFTKKARGKITFTCDEGAIIHQYIEKAIETGEGQTFWLTSKGIDEKGDVVSVFEFEWSVKIKK